MPPAIGLRLAEAIARWVAANPNLPMVQGIRLNQWVASCFTLKHEELAQATRAVISNIARSFYEQFYFMHHPERLGSQIVKNDVFEEIFAWQRSRRGGLLVCGLHMCSFDLVYQAITVLGLKTIGLTLPDETEAIAWQHQLRRKTGVELLPATLVNLRQVIRRLENGELVVTGIDRPQENLKMLPRFFGHPAHLPVHYVQLAQAAKVPLLVMAPFRQEDGRFQLSSSDYLTIPHHSNRKSDMIEHAEKVLAIAEGFVRRDPAQWTIFHPIWPELLNMVE